MQALQYTKSIPRYLLMRLGAKRLKGLDTSRLSPLQLVEIPEPDLPTPEWVRVRPLLSGVCGSDLSTLAASSSPYFSPLTSPPFVLGHEVVGEVAEDKAGFKPGDRVVVEPALGCRVRGIDSLCGMCTAGRYAECLNVTEGDILPGIQTGFCTSTGGGWSEMLVAHPTQLYQVPASLPDEAAVAIEPLACAVHAALKVNPGPDDTVLVLGAGSVGLLVIGALRQLTDAGRIICAAKYPRQQQEAMRLGADYVIPARELYHRLSAMVGAKRLEPELGKPIVLGGVDKTFECVGSAGTIEDAIRLTRPGGAVALVGMPGASSSLDLTPLWHQEVQLLGTYAYGVEEYKGERISSFGLALRIAPKLELERMVGPGFRLDQYREAIAAARSSGRDGNVKIVFDLRR